MIKSLFFLTIYLFFGCKNISNSDFNKRTEQEELNVFFEDFVKIKKNDYDFKKIKCVSYGDSLAFKYWIDDSKVDTTDLKKHFNFKNMILKNSIAYEKPLIFNNYKIFNFEDFYKFKLKNPNSNFNEYFSINFKKCELLSINFVVFNEERNKILIYHSLDCSYGYVEVYGKNNDEWVLLKKISQISQ